MFVESRNIMNVTKSFETGIFGIIWVCENQFKTAPSSPPQARTLYVHCTYHICKVKVQWVQSSDQLETKNVSVIQYLLFVSRGCTSLVQNVPLGTEEFDDAVALRLFCDDSWVSPLWMFNVSMLINSNWYWITVSLIQSFRSICLERLLAQSLL